MGGRRGALRGMAVGSRCVGAFVVGLPWSPPGVSAAGCSGARAGMGFCW